jgi:alpha-ketoglutarate-dependent taurine dioxygenase
MTDTWASGPAIRGVTEETIAPGCPLPLVLRPRRRGTDAASFAAEHAVLIRERVLRHGGVLMRGFSGPNIDAFRQVIVALSGQPLEYLERSSPRHEVGDTIYTSTDYPARQTIFMHNEQSYNLTWPMRIFFHCVVPPRAGGATPLADCRRVYTRIPERARERLERDGYCYARHFGRGLGLTWQEAFQTSRPKDVEEYCRANAISWEWEEGENLSTRQVRPVSVRHPVTGEQVWFNHLTFFNIRLLGADVAEALLAEGRESLPNNTYYADGSEIEPALLDELREAYEQETVRFDWEQGDVLILDNMLTAHGREPFTPPRKVVVGMSEPYSWSAGSR